MVMMMYWKVFDKKVMEGESNLHGYCCQPTVDLTKELTVVPVYLALFISQSTVHNNNNCTITINWRLQCFSLISKISFPNIKKKRCAREHEVLSISLTTCDLLVLIGKDLHQLSLNWQRKQVIQFGSNNKQIVSLVQSKWGLAHIWQLLSAIYPKNNDCKIYNKQPVHLYRRQSPFNQLAPLDVISAWVTLRSNSQTKINGRGRSPMKPGIKNARTRMERLLTR